MLEQVKLEIEQAQPAEGIAVKLVAIDGHGGSGKTFLAAQLMRLLKAEVLHTDDFASYDNPLEWWPRLVEEVMEPIKNGAQVLSYSRGSWYKNHSPEPVTGQTVTPTMILEGVSSSRKEFRHYLAYAIWVETPKEICMRRGIDRDLANNSVGKSEEEIKADWIRGHQYEDEYVKRDSPRSYANIIVRGAA